MAGSPNVFLISDTHFRHAGSVKWLEPDGSKTREFETSDEVDELMIENWNKTVKPVDKVYHLGDVSMGTNAAVSDILKRLNGTKVLIKGNHDIGKLSWYAEHFKDVRGSWQLGDYILTHIPIHPYNFYRFPINLHGYLHKSRIKLDSGEIDHRYLCMSVEQINYTPYPFEEIKKLMRV